MKLAVESRPSWGSGRVLKVGNSSADGGYTGLDVNPRAVTESGQGLGMKFREVAYTGRRISTPRDWIGVFTSLVGGAPLLALAAKLGLLSSLVCVQIYVAC